MFYVISANKQDFLPYNIEVIVDTNKLDKHLFKITIWHKINNTISKYRIWQEEH